MWWIIIGAIAGLLGISMVYQLIEGLRLLVAVALLPFVMKMVYEYLRFVKLKDIERKILSLALSILICIAVYQSWSYLTWLIIICVIAYVIYWLFLGGYVERFRSFMGKRS